MGPGKTQFPALLQHRHFAENNVMLLTFDVSGYKEGVFRPGDNIAIFPRNSDDEVDRLLKRTRSKPSNSPFLRASELGNEPEISSVFLTSN